MDFWPVLLFHDELDGIFRYSELLKGRKMSMERDKRESMWEMNDGNIKGMAISNSIIIVT